MQNNTFFNKFLLRIFFTISLTVLGIIIPLFFARAEILITEIAWMGTSNSQYEEWIELHNDGTDDVSLSGWKLFKTGGTTLFSPTGTITAGSYYLICRTTGTLTDPIDGTCNEKGAFGGSGLNNTNDQLVLKDDTGAVKISIDASGGWPAGDSANKQTMQKSGNEWVTAVATPGLETSSTPDPDTETDKDSEPEETEEAQNTPKDSPAIKKPNKEVIKKIEPDPLYEAHMIIPEFETAGVAVPMIANVTLDKRLKVLQGRYEWSTGDGGSYKFLKNLPIDHIYYYPGTYTVVLQYYSNRFKEEPDTIHRKTIIIAPSSIEILGYSTNEGLQLKNNSTKEINLDGWIIQSSGKEFIFPKYTTIAKSATLALSPEILKIAILENDLGLLNPSRKLITKYSQNYTSLKTADIPDEAFSDSPEVPSIPMNEYKTKPTPQSKTFMDIWHQNKWYVILGIVALGVILAYLAFHLYAKSDEELL